MGRGSDLLRGAVPDVGLRRLPPALLLALLVLISACSNGTTDGTDGDGTTTTTVGTDPVVTTSTQPVAGDGGPAGDTTTSTTQSAVRDPNLGVLITYRDRLVTAGTEGEPVTVLGDQSRTLRLAFDDLNGGFVYQYDSTPPEFGEDAILHLPRGESEPVLLLNAESGQRLDLVDVNLLDGLVTVIALSTTTDATGLLSIPLAGGAAAPLLTVPVAGGIEPPADNEFLYESVVGGSVGGELVGHLNVEAD